MVLFASLGVLRRLTKAAYTPSYFVLFPMSLMDADIAAYYSEGLYPPSLSASERQELRRSLLIKTIAAAAITFVLLPALVGGLVALFMAESEVMAFISILVIWQGYNAFHSTMDNAGSASRTGASLAFFAGFYALYLFVLSGGIWLAYEFVAEYMSVGDWGGLLSQIWRGGFKIIVGVIFAGAIGSVVAHLITDREVIRGG
jgi:hypothetical protein